MENSIFFYVFIWVGILYSIVLHEISHGGMALLWGDPTAKMSGRLSLNPLPHIDPLGTIVFPLICIIAKVPVFGYAKPVPVDFNRLKNIRVGTVFVALAGPLMNILIAFLMLFVSKAFFSYQGDTFDRVTNQLIVTNCVLAVFNCLPILPLDGGRILNAFLPTFIQKSFQKIEPFGFFIVIFFVAILPELGQILGIDLSFIDAFLKFVVLKIITIFDGVIP